MAPDEATDPIEATEAPEAEENDGRGITFWIFASIGGSIFACVALFLIAMVVGAASGRWESVASVVMIIRDLLVILLVLEGILIGVALIVMISQLSALMNILQNEVQPILDNTQQTTQTVRGTAEFMSKHVTGPVIRTKGFIAGSTVFIRQLVGIRKAISSGDVREPTHEEEA